ncbi:hypothetical protein KDV50_25155, partial [Citrobacter sedlakii]
KSVRAELSESEKRISAAILDHDRKLSSAMSQRTKGMLRMVSHVWLTMRSIPFVRWLMAEDSFRSWSRMAALILFSLSLSS